MSNRGSKRDFEFTGSNKGRDWCLATASSSRMRITGTRERKADYQSTTKRQYSVTTASSTPLHRDSLQAALYQRLNMELGHWPTPLLPFRAME